ncbi:MAG TPA: alkaline phosphatase family protein, partial [Chthoniobacteraceae bacterium]|nr:alkaline phosphatase family protein [Chthoniobacteraceae bacterium]
VSYCTAYHNDLAIPSGGSPSIHPSEPNYVWGEAGSNLGKLDDNDPYGSGGSVPQIVSYLQANRSICAQHLTGLMQAAGIPWKSYQEGIDHQNISGGNANLGGALTNTLLPQAHWTVPLASFSGSNAAYTNPYNGSDEWNFACKHDGSLFFPDTNGSTPAAAVTGTNNTEVAHYAPLEQLATDLSNNTVARYNIITPDEYNDMHTALPDGFTYKGIHYTGDLAQVAQGDHFLSVIVPQIMASQAYRNNGCIVVWTDETEGTNQNDFNHTLTEIIVSPLAKGNGYAGNLNYTHSSDLATMQEIFHLVANTSPTGYLNDAGNASNSTGAYANSPGFGTGTAHDLSDLFRPGAIPSGTVTDIPGNVTTNGQP